jgi:hypothetical protein
MAALCIECGRNKTFERGVKRCSDCEAAVEARAPGTDVAAAPPSASEASATSPGSLLGIGIVLQLIGGLIMGATLLNAENNGGFLIGVLIAWAGGLALLVALIAFGVKIGIQAAAPTRQPS